MKCADVLACSVDKWYPLFSDVSVTSVILPMPDVFVNYLLSDGVFLPDTCLQQQECLCDNSVASTSADGGPCCMALNCNEFDFESSSVLKEFHKSVVDAIESLGGRVFPKLNWSSPKDAAWITLNHTLYCTTPNDVFLLLKSSDFVTHDLTEPFLLCEDSEAANSFCRLQYVLALRQWKDIAPAYEFRCFVRQRQLLAVSQRHSNEHFSCLSSNSVQDMATAAIEKLFEEHLRDQFCLDCYVFDCYLVESGDKGQFRGRLLDFNPWSEVTDSLLFNWKELKVLDIAAAPLLRCITDANMKPNPNDIYRMPTDFLYLGAGNSPEMLEDFMNLKLAEEKLQVSLSDNDSEDMAT